MWPLEYYRRLTKKVISEPLKFPGYWRLLRFTNILSKDYPSEFLRKGLPPMTISIRITFRCQLRCIQCPEWGKEGYFRYVDSNKFSLENELSTSEWKSFLKEVASFRPFVYFTGGEPLMREDIIELIRWANKHHLVTSLSTNALLLKEKAQELIDSGLDYLYISLDGPPDTNEKIRLGSSSSSEAVDAAIYFLNLRNRLKRLSPMVEIRTVIVKENEDKLFKTALFVDNNIKPEAFGLQCLHYTTQSQLKKAEPIYNKKLGINGRLYWASSVFDPSAMNTSILEKEMEKIKKKKWHFKVHYYPPLDHPKFSWQTYFRDPEDPIGFYDYCGSLYSIGVIQPNGNVVTCPCSQDYVSGNIRKNPFLSIWRGDRHNHFREVTQRDRPATCSRCRAHFTFRKKSLG